LLCGLSIGDFWSMTPREVLLVLRAASERRLDGLDELLIAAWHGALWGGVQRVKKLPDLKDALSRRRAKSRPRTLEEDIRRWEIFFRSVKPEKAN